MKKIYIMMLLVLTGTMALAQTSVWHGGRQIWTRGTGTENDPFLIESADNLAYLAYVVNKGYDTKDMYFRLTTDIDLNGSADLQWTPIGCGTGGKWFSEDGCFRGYPSYGYFYDGVIPSFHGHFDGGEHSISNIYIDNSEGIYANNIGLFGMAEGERNGQEVYPAVIENVFVTSGYIKGSICGGIVANGNGTTMVSRCWNGATVDTVGYSSGRCGGIVGWNAYKVINCYNKGNISGYYVGGIVGYGAIEIEQCYNEGDVSGTYSGGIFGFSMNGSVTINNCFNTGSITADGSGINSAPAGPAAGGIASFFRGNSVISNCYNVGAISSTRDAGCILAYGPSATLENNYYISTCDAGGEGEPLDEDNMHGQAFVDLLNSMGTGQVWVLDENGTNGGFPILASIDLAVTEISEVTFEVYPNPAQGRFTVEGAGTVTISNVMGQTVLTRKIDGKETIALPRGMYFVKLGNQTRKIVVE